MSWLRYNNKGAIRSQPLSPKLVDALSFLPEMGIEMEVFSGGQAAKGSGGPRTGSTRHDHGNAADADFYYKGRKLDWNNPEDVPIFKAMVQTGKQRGVTGWGAGDDYMGAGRMHVGFGNPGIWGAGGKGANAPSWLREAYHGQPGHNHKPGDENQKIADDTMAALGKTPSQATERAPTVSTSGGGSILGGFDDMEAPTMEPEKAGGILGSLFPNMTAERQDSIALALGGLSMHPNQAMMESVKGRMDGRRDEARDARAAATEQAKLNKTVQWLAQQPGGQRYAEAIASGVPLSQAWSAYMQERQAGSGSNLPASVIDLQWRAEQAGLKPGTPEYQAFVQNGGGDPSNFRALHMQALAAGFQPGTPEYEEFMATRGAGLQAGAKTTATNEANIATGGEAARVVKEGEMAPVTAKEFGDQAAMVRSSITNMNDAIDAIDRGANSGVVYKMLPALSESSASLRNSMNRLGLDVIGSVTFGALSAAEMQLAMETAVPRNLEPAALRDWLERKRVAQQKAYQALNEAARHFASGGTQAQYYSNIGAEIGQPETPAAPTGGGTKRLRFNPETGELE